MNIKFFRIERQLSQYELAEATGVPRWAIQLIEAGIREPSSEERQILAQILGLNSEAQPKSFNIKKEAKNA